MFCFYNYCNLFNLGELIIRFILKKNEDKIYLLAGSVMIGWSLFVLISNFIFGSRDFFIVLAFITSITGSVLIIYVYLGINHLIPNTFTGLFIRMVPGLLLGIGFGSLQAHNLSGGAITLEGIFLILLALLIGLITTLYALELKEFTYIAKRYWNNRKSSDSNSDGEKIN